MQLGAKKRVSRNRNFRPAVRFICDELVVRAQKSPIRVEIKDFWEKADYMPVPERRATTGMESYIAAQVVKRLRRKHNLCVVPIRQEAFAHSLSYILKLSPGKTIPLLAPTPYHPTTGMYISAVADGNLFAGYETMNQQRQLFPRVKEFQIRAKRELENNRLSKPAKAALLQNTKKLAADISHQLRLPY